jgi:hypothetical protein
MTKIIAPAKDLLDGLRMFAMPYGADYLFTPLVLEARDGKVSNTVRTKAGGAFSRGIVESWKVERETPEGTQIVIDSGELIDAIANFPPEVIVTFEVVADGSVTLTSVLKKGRIIPKQIPPSVPKVLPTFGSDGRLDYGLRRKKKPKGGGEDYSEAEIEADLGKTRVEVTSEALAEFVADADSLKMKDQPKFPLEFLPGENGGDPGFVRAEIGSLQTKQRSWDTKVPAEVKGAKAAIIVGKDFRNVISNFKGKIEIQLTDGNPMVVVFKGDKRRSFVVLSALKES